MSAPPEGSDPTTPAAFASTLAEAFATAATSARSKPASPSKAAGLPEEPLRTKAPAEASPPPVAAASSSTFVEEERWESISGRTPRAVPVRGHSGHWAYHEDDCRCSAFSDFPCNPGGSVWSCCGSREKESRCRLAAET